MKIRRVLANNRRKSFVLETKNGTMEFPYSQLKVKPSPDNSVVGVYVDPDLAREGFTYTLKSGKEDSILLDDVLFYNKDSGYLRDLLLHQLTVQAIEALKQRKISKRHLARKLKTSPRQLYRLLNPAYYGKTIDQMVKLLQALGHEIEILAKRAA